MTSTSLHAPGRLARRRLGRRRMLIVGCGDVGMRALALLRAQDPQGPDRALTLTSKPQRLAELRAAGALPLLGDLDRPASLARLRGLASRVLYFAPPPSEGADDPRLRRLLAVLARPARLRGARCAPAGKGLGGGKSWLSAKVGILTDPAGSPRLVYISTTGVYGDCDGKLVTESRPVRPANARAVRRLAAEARLRIWGARAGRAVSILRAPGIYAEDRLPLERLRAGTPALISAQDVYTNHIHADDLARMALRGLDRNWPQRVYNAVDHTRLKMGEYFDLVADWAGLPRPPRVDREAAAAALSPMMLSFMKESRQLENRRIVEETGFVFRHPTVEDFLRGTLPLV
ncbi:MAG: SDR family NAD(P)-dependent oxidoreductase [Candidatus Protistobacter heckmanni]|nr:SDR family NAD(P)-dependent oxidoreductase [Candidatus Protistobacter heckmanni]